MPHNPPEASRASENGERSAGAQNARCGDSQSGRKHVDERDVDRVVVERRPDKNSEGCEDKNGGHGFTESSRCFDLAKHCGAFQPRVEK
jgi:hypothetical protein